MTTQTEHSPAPVVEMSGITVTFPGVRALDSVDFRLFPGEVHALMGENGAGKSTLIKALTGVYRTDGGSIKVDGQPYHPGGPAETQAAGIATVYQEVNLCGNMTVAENVALGHEVRRGPFIDWRATRRVAQESLTRLRLDINPRSQLSSHSIAVQQLCAIARALMGEAKVLILDEPTSSLDTDEVAELFTIIRELRDQGVAILFVSHFLDQCYEICDRMTILRNGELIGEYLTADLPRQDLVSKMVGHAVDTLEDIGQDAQEAAQPERNAATVLEARGLGRRNAVDPFDLDVRQGEIVGFAGLLGSGRSEAARLFSGADAPDAGELLVDGEKTRFASPLEALKKGIAYSSEDRKADGIIADLSVRENIGLALQAQRGAWRPIPRKELDEVVDRYMTALNIRPRNPDMPIGNLSGGNQQKALLARWLAANPELIILDEPTRGIDVGAKAEIQRLVAKLAGDGMSVVFISSELDEVVRLSRRIAIMRDRHMIAIVDNTTDLDQARILAVIAEAGDEGDPPGGPARSDAEGERAPEDTTVVEDHE